LLAFIVGKLCMHDGGLRDMTNLCANHEVKRPTAQHFIELLEATYPSVVSH
jgi:hypothetical protein